MHSIERNTHQFKETLIILLFTYDDLLEPHISNKKHKIVKFHWCHVEVGLPDHQQLWLIEQGFQNHT